MPETTILVIGAGPAGLSLARALSVRGLHVDVIERQGREAIATPAADGREIALTRASLRILGGLGILGRIDPALVSPLVRARVADGNSADGFEVDAAPFGHAALGGLVANRDIRAAAWAAVEEDPRIRVHCDARIASVATGPGEAEVVLEDGRRFAAPLLVAADSRFSSTRRALGIPVAMHDFGKTMLVCRVRPGRDHGGVAWEWFGQGQTRALLPLNDGLASAVLTVTGAEAERLQALAPAEFAAALEARYEGRFGRMPLEGGVHAYPLVATWAHRFVARRFALVGDAAVGMHPVTAHGFNLGLASVERLAAAVSDAMARHGDPAHPALLARYQRRHRAGSATLFLGTGLVVRVFTDDRAPAQPLRRAIMQAARALPPLRRALADALLDAGPVDPTPLQRLRRGWEVLRPRAASASRLQ
ncbi:MAG TPA: 5-demethoxyubiquinol-8 5-hydroxylase UbiM [Luteimonas sp.]